ncbi:hypothetical protein [Streptomyces drozdowiczii]|uniref:hypothetical protein n=1 Tax=Streptomyces drozdowiczii TaxID=202862 RepID=UPI00403D04E1
MVRLDRRYLDSTLPDAVPPSGQNNRTGDPRDRLFRAVDQNGLESKVLRLVEVLRPAEDSPGDDTR